MSEDQTTELVGTLVVALFIWVPVLWARYQASRFSLQKPWRFGFILGCVAHGASLLLSSPITVPFELFAAPHIETEPYLSVQAEGRGVSLSLMSMFVDNASVLLEGFFLLAVTLVAPKRMAPAWRRLYG